ncbi:hypothetical protein [Rhodococcus phenolicus]|uniref:hypothetical protein n=1 Tax=Rhodococcus phenolicus TaxID=263849 RepID=UPI000B1A6DF0|nr:hypothetical protein [Rhodococcus phenolicus]
MLRWRRGMVAGAVVVSLSCGCSGMPGGTEGDLSRAAADAASATASAQLGLSLVAAHRTTGNHADVVLDDALEAVLTSYSAAATAETSSEDEAAHRDVLLGYLEDAASALGRARGHVAGVPGSPDAPALDGELARLTDSLSAFGEGAR